MDEEKRQILSDFDKDFAPKVITPITSRTQSNSVKTEEQLDEEYQRHLNDMSEFVASFDGCSVSPEIMGEWNVIKKEINDYLFSYNLQFDGSCPHMKKFFLKETEHLNSIKNKMGANAIEYQMICSLVAEAIILDIESCMILEEKQAVFNSSPTIKRLSYQAMLKDSLNILEDVSSLNMEYQYKYEKFTPFYKSLSEKGKLAGLAKDEPEKPKSGCLSIIIIAIVSTMLCSFILI